MAGRESLAGDSTIFHAEVLGTLMAAERMTEGLDAATPRRSV